MKNVILFAAVAALIYFLYKQMNKGENIATVTAKPPRTAFGDVDLTAAINLTLERVK